MELNKNSNHNSLELVNKNEKIISTGNIENYNYLYPNGHRITHQMRWFKASRDMALRAYLSASRR